MKILKDKKQAVEQLDEKSYIILSITKKDVEDYLSSCNLKPKTEVTEDIVSQIADEIMWNDGLSETFWEVFEDAIYYYLVKD